MTFFDKKWLRMTYLQKRMTLSEEDYRQDNQCIYNHFFSHVDFSSVHLIHSFIPILSKKEPDTQSIMCQIEKQYPHIRFSIPKIDFKNNTLHPILYQGQQLNKNKWGILEPVLEQEFNFAVFTEIDIVIVPLLAFDLEGHRVGYGKGYYDRFLSNCRLNCKKIGLSFFSPVKKILTDAWDIPLTSCISPKRVYQF